MLDEGVTPTTAHIHLIRHGATTATEVLGSDIRPRPQRPVYFLKNLHIVDTPGTNAIIREHERLTRVRAAADFVLFVTSADRPFTETERAFIERFAPGARRS